MSKLKIILSEEFEGDRFFNKFNISEEEIVSYLRVFNEEYGSFADVQDEISKQNVSLYIPHEIKIDISQLPIKLNSWPIKYYHFDKGINPEIGEICLKD